MQTKKIAEGNLSQAAISPDGERIAITTVVSSNNPDGTSNNQETLQLFSRTTSELLAKVNVEGASQITARALMYGESSFHTVTMDRS